MGPYHFLAECLSKHSRNHIEKSWEIHPRLSTYQMVRLLPAYRPTSSLTRKRHSPIIDRYELHRDFCTGTSKTTLCHGFSAFWLRSGKRHTARNGSVCNPLYQDTGHNLVHVRHCRTHQTYLESCRKPRSVSLSDTIRSSWLTYEKSTLMGVTRNAMLTTPIATNR